MGVTWILSGCGLQEDTLGNMSMAGNLAALLELVTLSIFLIDQSMTKSNYKYMDGNKC